MLEKKFKHDAADGALSGIIGFEDTKTHRRVSQDIKPILDEVKEERAAGFNRKANYRKFASIPDVVAIEIATKYGINIHNDETIRDQSEMKKFRNIIIREYPYLLVST